MTHGDGFESRNTGVVCLSPRTTQLPAADRRAHLDSALTWASNGGSLLFLSRTRLGRSMVLDAVATHLAKPRVLRCLPTRTHTGVAYLALADLLSTVTDAELGSLPRPQRGALSGALRRGGTPTGPAAAPGRVRTAVRTLLGNLARQDPLLLVIHDVQRLDPASRAALSHLTSLPEREQVQLLAAEWLPEERAPVGCQLAPPQTLILPLNSFSAVDVLSLSAQAA